jgi:DNA-binding transcriptional LysR family regulator
MQTMQSSDLALLATLDALLQEGSVTKAARRVGLSTPAMSHALARIRERVGDPLLVRAGREMVLTPRAEAMRPKVRSAITQAAQALEPEAPFAPATLERGFVVIASDYVVTVLGVELDALLGREAPRIALRFVVNTPSDPTVLREGSADLAVGIYGELPPELKTKVLLTDRFVCVVRKDHPAVKKRLTLDEFVAMSHVQIAPRGRAGGYVDGVLAERGLSRRVVRAVPFFLAALRLTAKTDYVLTVSERVAKATAEDFGLRILEPPLELSPYALKQVWHPRWDGDAGHRFLRESLARAAQTAAGDVHPGARTTLGRRRAR